MSYYAIGFGGTGAKCIEALIHLCAAGMLPDDEKLYILFVDQDSDNGSLGRAQELLKVYKRCREQPYEASTSFLKTPLLCADTNNWLPEGDRATTLASFVKYGNLTPEFKNLFDVLFDQKEKETEMGKGFRGHPSIGSAVFAATADLNEVDTWKDIRSRLERDVNSGKHPKVMFFGSIFGGTGAAGVPTISRLFKDWSKKFPESPFKLGGVLAMPYFTFKPYEQDDLHADARDFLVNTQAALQYYHQQDYMEVFDKAYLLGCKDPHDVGKAEIGSQNQKNPPHWIEVYAALAAIDFFASKSLSEERYNFIARADEKKLQWTDLPYDSTESRKKLTTLLRFAFAYRAVYLPAIKRLNSSSENPYWAPWYIDFFQRTGVDVKSKLDNELGQVASYCDSFLKWIAGIEYSITGNTGTKFLVDYSPFARLAKDNNEKVEIDLLAAFDLSKFAKFGIGESSNETDLESLWERMCECYSEGSASNGAWKFIDELYWQCGR